MSTQGPYVELFGRGTVHAGEGGLAFASDKRWYLLAFLAHAGAWVSRERLAALFWPDVPTTASRDRLRQLLRRVRGFTWLSGLQVERARVRWAVDTDLGAFRAALDEGDGAQALEAYQGPLLEGMTADDAPEFAAWLELERATLHNRWRALLLEEAGQATTDTSRAKAIPRLATLLRADPLDEEALRAYMTVLAGAGQRPRALDAYQGFAQHLGEELGLEPALATQRLSASMREAASAPASSRRDDPEGAHAVAAAVAPTNAFVGRDVELLEVMAMLSSPGCRMLSLVGLGGVGKSRIAWQVHDAWEGRAHFVRLDGLADSSDIPAAIADTLGCATGGTEDLLERIAGHIGDTGMLLVLDDYEHLTEGAGLTSELLGHCPALSILVTSRERLGVPEEWIYDVPGLSVPPGDVPLSRAQGYDAVRLFLTRVEQVRDGYALTEADRPHVLRICQLVQGLPLGLELAAAWMRSATAEAIADEVAANLDFLQRRHASDRHHSIRAVFESSWRMLTHEEQRAYAALSVFRGGFTRDAASAVAQASTPILAALVDKSLLQLQDDGRYQRHPLLYQYVREKLAQYEEEYTACRRHARYFVAVAEEAGSKLRTTRGVADLDALEADHENLREALRWGVAHDPALALRLAGALGRFWEIRGHLIEGCEWLEASLGRAHDAPSEVEGRALDAYGRLLYLRGDREGAASRIQAALERWREADDEDGVSSALNHLGALAMEAGDLARAEALVPGGAGVVPRARMTGPASPTC
ncbi:MAG: BTAD domain-containing putative transcriptional regulator [Trueperaceae bacterium]|nr:BTAD domain-containing putative transcriptional regulator [Trueperaceae bacterium]